MITSNNKLRIFEEFQIDYNLPKYNQGQKVDLVSSLPVNNGIGWAVVQQGTSTVASFNGSNFGSVLWSDSGNGQTPDFVEIKEKKKKSYFWNNWFNEKKKVVEEKKKTVTILTFFSSLAQSLNDLKTLQDIAIHYEIAITNASKAGQTALVDKLKTRLESAKSEVQLVTLKLNKFLVEEQVVDFYKKTNSDKKLKLTWIKHFVKNIPSKILEVKENLDKQFIFDNYVILHYDPNDDATDISIEEKKEIERRQKDPILFGVIKDSRRLYYVGDWIDEYCNLTLDVVMETLGEKVNEINNDSVKTYIDRGERIDDRKLIEKGFTGSGTTFQMPVKFETVKKDLNKITKKVKREIKKIGLPKFAKKRK